MQKIVRKTMTLLGVYYAYMVEYRAELILWVLSGSLPIILMGIWMEASQNGQFGLKPVDFARYFLAVFIVRQISTVWVIWDFEREVVEGKLSFRLLQPIDPIWHHIASHVGERFARLPFSLGLVVLFFLLYPQSFWVPSLSKVLLFLVATALSFALRFLIQYTFAMFTFWIERAAAIEQFWFLPYLFLSGIVAPLELFPSEVRDVVVWTPFPYLIHFPAALLLGLPDVDAVRGFLTISFWLLAFFLWNRWLWRRGLKHYSGMGA